MSRRGGLELVVSLSVALVTGAGCSTLSKLLPGREKPAPAQALQGFDSVDIGGGMAAEVTVGTDFGVAFAGDPALAQRVSARVEGDRLLVAAGDPQAAAGVRVRIGLPRLEKLAVRGRSTVTMPDVQGGRLLVEVAEGSRVVLAGSADNVAFSLTGASKADARQLKVRTVRVSLSGGSRLDVRPDVAMLGKASEGSLLTVWNKPRRVRVATRSDAGINYLR